MKEEHKVFEHTVEFEIKPKKYQKILQEVYFQLKDLNDEEKTQFKNDLNIIFNIKNFLR